MTPRRLVAVVTFAIALGVVTAASAEAAVVVALACAAVAASFIVPFRVWTSVLVVACVCVPWDFIGVMGAELRTLPITLIVWSSVPLLVGRLRGWEGGVEFVRRQWDLLLLIGVLVAAVIVSGDLGGLREVLPWTAGFIVLALVGTAIQTDDLTITHVALVLIGCAAFLGIGAVAERLVGGSPVWSVIPEYEPIVRSFSEALGERANSWAGHPLRLGTVSALGVLCGTSLLLRRGGNRLALVLGLVFASAGLVLSGARGSWIASAVGVAVLLLGAADTGRARRVAVVAALALAGFFTMQLVGLDNLIVQRISGEAVDPLSIAQRFSVLGVAAALWRQSPWIGYGFRAVEDLISSQGLVLRAYENEYVGFLLAAGAFGLATLSVFILRTGIALVRAPRSDDRALILALFLGMIINIGTYNMFFWSAGPLLFCLVVALARGYSFEPNGSSG